MEGEEMTGAEYQRMARIVHGAAIKEFMVRVGYYPVNAMGKILMKSVGLAMEREGRLVRWNEKPGWSKGELVDQAKYKEWFENVEY
jgi:hypothetical protein